MIYPSFISDQKSCQDDDKGRHSAQDGQAPALDGQCWRPGEGAQSVQGLVSPHSLHGQGLSLSQKCGPVQRCFEVDMTLGHQQFQSWSNFKKLINSGHLLGQYQVVDVNRFVRKASNRYREPYLWILSRYSNGSKKSPLSWSNFRFYFVTWTFKSGLGMFAMLCSFQNWYWKVKLGKI